MEKDFPDSHEIFGAVGASFVTDPLIHLSYGTLDMPINSHVSLCSPERSWAL